MLGGVWLKSEIYFILMNFFNHFRLIFAGKELPDSLILNQCDLGQNSILHAVRIVAASPSKEKKDCDAPRDSKTNSIPINDLPLKDGRSNSKSKEELLDLAQTEGETNEVGNNLQYQVY